MLVVRYQIMILRTPVSLRIEDMALMPDPVHAEAHKSLGCS
jgi:hypothetical protein